jgi:hypothetical protein
VRLLRNYSTNQLSNSVANQQNSLFYGTRFSLCFLMPPKVPRCYGSRNHIGLSIIAHHCTLFWVTSLQITSLQPIFLWSISLLPSHICIVLYIQKGITTWASSDRRSVGPYFYGVHEVFYMCLALKHKCFKNYIWLFSFFSLTSAVLRSSSDICVATVYIWFWCWRKTVLFSKFLILGNQ